MQIGFKSRGPVIVYFKEIEDGTDLDEEKKADLVLDACEFARTTKGSAEWLVDGVEITLFVDNIEGGTYEINFEPAFEQPEFYVRLKAQHHRPPIGMV